MSVKVQIDTKSVFEIQSEIHEVCAYINRHISKLPKIKEVAIEATSILKYVEELLRISKKLNDLVQADINRQLIEFPEKRRI